MANKHLSHLAITLKGKGTDAQRTVDVPLSLDHVELSNYCDYMGHIRETQKWMAGLEEEGQLDLYNPQFMFEYLGRMTQAIVDFCDVHEEDMENFQLGSWDEYCAKFLCVKDPEAIDPETAVETVCHLHHYLYMVTARHKPRLHDQDFEFEYRGKTFVIKKTERDFFTSKFLVPEMTLQEGLEVLDLKRKIANNKKDNEGDLLFTEILGTMAILARMPGESLPLDDTRLKSFVDERTRFFAGMEDGQVKHPSITAGIALDVDFFLRLQLGIYRRTKEILTFSVLPIPQLETVQNLKP